MIAVESRARSSTDQGRPARRIALDHGGSLVGENHPQRGAVFVLELPVKTDV